MNYRKLTKKQKNYGVNVNLYRDKTQKLESEKIRISNRIVEINQIMAGKVDILGIEERDSLTEERSVLKEIYADIRDELICRRRNILKETDINRSYLIP